MSERRNRFSDDAFRARVRQMVAAGYSDAQIVKETGKSVVHVRLVAGQERAALAGEAEAPNGRG